MLRDLTSLQGLPPATRLAGGRPSHPTAIDSRALLEAMALDAALERWVRELLELVVRLDAECAVHSVSCARVTIGLGRALGWCGPALRRLTLGALLHDIGKLSISGGILRKPARLTPAERRRMQRHTTIGAAILEATALPDLDLPAEIARSHHERWDGAGYPDRLEGESIPWSARIVAVADVYDALRRPRAYRPPLPEAAALELMQTASGRQFDPEVLDCFLALDPSFRRIALEPGLPPDGLAPAPA